MTEIFQIVLACDGVPAALGEQAAREITEEFAQRHWHQDVRCDWRNGELILNATNDFDESGLALIDEFSDVISQCVTEPFDGDIVVRSISRVNCSKEL